MTASLWTALIKRWRIHHGVKEETTPKARPLTAEQANQTLALLNQAVRRG
jgi:hypothetical protein